MMVKSNQLWVMVAIWSLLAILSLEKKTPDYKNLYNKMKDLYKNSQLKLGFSLFHCALTVMKNYLERIYPTFSSSTHYLRYTEVYRKDPLPEDLDATIESFHNIEDNLPFQISPENQAKTKIPVYYYTMYAICSRCKSTGLIDMHSLKSEDNARAITLRTRLLSYHKKDIKSEDDEILVFKKFAASVARIRHGVNGYHYQYDHFMFERTRILRQEYKREVDLPEVLDDIGLLTPWNFSKVDIDYLNLIRKTLDPKEYPFSHIEYNFVNKKRTKIKGILPLTNSKSCPNLAITR